MQLLKKVLHFSAQRYLKTAGDLFIYHSDYVGALSQVQKALEVDSQDTRALVLQGDILFCLNRDLEALVSLNKALEIDPTLAEGHLSKAGVLEVLGKPREALQCCQKALENIKPSKYYLLGSLFDQEIALLIRVKRFREAQRVLNKAAAYLSEDELDFLLASYKHLLDHLCKTRQMAKSTVFSAPLVVLNGTTCL